MCTLGTLGGWIKAGRVGLLVLKSWDASPLVLLCSSPGFVVPLPDPFADGLTDIPASELVKREAAMSSRRFRILVLASFILS